MDLLSSFWMRSVVGLSPKLYEARLVREGLLNGYVVVYGSVSSFCIGSFRRGICMHCLLLFQVVKKWCLGIVLSLGLGSTVRSWCWSWLISLLDFIQIHANNLELWLIWEVARNNRFSPYRPCWFPRFQIPIKFGSDWKHCKVCTMVVLISAAFHLFEDPLNHEGLRYITLFS